MATATFLYTNNATSTLNGAISNVAVTATLSPGSGALFPNPGTGQQFALTFTDAATGLLREIVYVTARSSDTITMIRAQEGTTALAWSAGDLAQSLFTAGNAAQMLQPGSSFIRTILTSATTFFVSTTGNDSTGNGSSGAPWATAQHAVSFIENNLDFAGFTVTIQLADGTYNQNVSFHGQSPGQQGPIFFKGNSSAPTNVVWNGSIQGDYLGNVTVQYMLIKNDGTTAGTGSGCLLAGIGSVLSVSFGITFGAIASGYAHMYVNGGGAAIFIGASYAVTSGGGEAHWQLFNQGQITIVSGITVTFTNSPTFSIGVLYASACSVFGLSQTNAIFTGTVIGSKYNISFCSIATINGASTSTLPGNSSGTTTFGGQIA